MALHTAAAQRPGPLTAAFLVSHRPAAALGLCLGSFHHREGSSVDCSLISFRSSFKILFSGAFLADSASFSGHPSPGYQIGLRLSALSSLLTACPRPHGNVNKKPRALAGQ